MLRYKNKIVYCINQLLAIQDFLVYTSFISRPETMETTGSKHNRVAILRELHPLTIYETAIQIQATGASIHTMK